MFFIINKIILTTLQIEQLLQHEELQRLQCAVQQSRYEVGQAACGRGHWKRLTLLDTDVQITLLF